MTEGNITNSSMMPNIEPTGMPSLAPTGMPTVNETIPIETSSTTKSDSLGYIVMGVVGFCILGIFTGVIAYIKYKSSLSKFGDQDSSDHSFRLTNLGETTIFDKPIGDDSSSSEWTE